MTLNLDELVVVSQTFVDILLGQCEEVFGEFGLGAHEEVEAGFLHCEILERHGRGFGVEVEGLAVGIGRRLEAVHWPVAAFDGVFDAILGVGHVDAVRDAGAISDDERRAFVFFGFLEGLEGLVAVGAEGDLGDIDVAVSHSELAEILLAARFTAGSEFGDGAAAGGLGGLTAGVGVHFGVEDEDVDVAAQ